MSSAKKEVFGGVLIQSVNGNLQMITSASGNVSEETKNVTKSAASLQETAEQFHL